MLEAAFDFLHLATRERACLDALNLNKKQVPEIGGGQVMEMPEYTVGAY